MVLKLMQIRNPNLEIRNKHEESNSEDSKRLPPACDSVSVIWVLCLEFVSDFELRYSCFFHEGSYSQEYSPAIHPQDDQPEYEQHDAAFKDR